MSVVTTFTRGRKTETYDLLSIILLVFILLFSLLRIRYLPQFIDGYYHLSCANAFIKSGGWVGIDWWSFAPAGRPHLYPPLYHLLLVLLIKTGLAGIVSVKITEALTAPLFFTLLWAILRRHTSSAFSFFFVCIAMSFFSFFASVSANVPASLAMVFGMVSWHCFMRKKPIAGTSFLVLSFYTHNGIPWIFLISFILVLMRYPLQRKHALFIIGTSVVCALPLLLHQSRYVSYISLQILREVTFSHFSIFILLFGFVSFLRGALRKDILSILFCGYVLGSVFIFLKYPYRFFSAQGMFGFILLASWPFARFFAAIEKASLGKKALLGCVIAYLFIFHSTFDLDEGRLVFTPVNSTYYNIASGKFGKMLEFRSLYSPRHYDSIVETTVRHSDPNDIITANIKIGAQIFSALSGRPASVSMLGEVRQFTEHAPYRDAKLIIWLKPKDETIDRLTEELRLNLLHENDIAYVYENPLYDREYAPVKSSVGFGMSAAAITLILLVFFIDLRMFSSVKSAKEQPVSPKTS